MGNKTIVTSVAAGTIIASAFLATTDVDAASYKVKNGDSLWAIAQKYDTNVSHLKEINNLSNSIIFPKQVLETGQKKHHSKSNSSKQSKTKTTTYKVKSGDTLSGIAFDHDVSFSDIMKWNNLDSTLIHPGDTLKVNNSKTSSTTKPSNNKSSSSNGTHKGGGKVESAKVYKVKSGDTLSGIALKNNTTVSKIKKENNLKSDLIHINQKLNINVGNSKSSTDSNKKTHSNSNDNKTNTSSNTSSNNVDYNVNKLINTANKMSGTKYVWGGSSPSGFDCSGFIDYTYNKAGKSISRLSSEGYFNRSHYINNPKKGDLIFFKDTYKKGISHLGIYLGNDQFISAESDGVKINSVDNPYWSKHFDSYKRFY